MQIGFDVDGVLADWNRAFSDALVVETGRQLNPAFKEWHWDLAAGYSTEESNRTWRSHILDSPKFWRKLKPLPGAPGIGRQLNRLEKAGHGLYFITARTGSKPRVQTEEWLYYELGVEFPAVIISNQKMPIIKSLGIEFYIDDRLDTMHELLTMKKEHFYLLDTSYNRKDRHPDLKVVASVEDAMRSANLWMDSPTK